jgi:hypothetical protein
MSSAAFANGTAAGRTTATPTTAGGQRSNSSTIRSNSSVVTISSSIVIDENHEVNRWPFRQFFFPCDSFEI